MRQNVVFILCCALLAYFAFHAVKGEHGLEARTRLQSKSERLVREFARLEAERARLERNVALMSGPHVDRDMLAEQARRILVMGHSADIAIITSGLPKR